MPSTYPLRYAFRKLLKTPVFTAIALGTLALGIGANTTIFSVVEGVLIRPLPYPEPDQLVMLWHTAPGIDIEEFEQSNTTYTLYRERNQSFVDVGITNEFALNLTGDGNPARIDAASASSSVFRVLEANAILGRLFTPDDDEWGEPNSVILGEKLWRSRYGADPGVLGQTMQLSGRTYEIVGVLPAGFNYPSEDAQLWLQFKIDPASLGQADFSFESVARLKPGVTLEAAQADLNRMLATLPDAYPGQNTHGLMKDAQMSAFEVHLYGPVKEDGTLREVRRWLDVECVHRCVAIDYIRNDANALCRAVREDFEWVTGVCRHGAVGIREREAHVREPRGRIAIEVLHRHRKRAVQARRSEPGGGSGANDGTPIAHRQDEIRDSLDSLRQHRQAGQKCES